MNPITAKSQIRPAALKKCLDSGEKMSILDVREPNELKICCLPNTINIPMSQLADRLTELENFKTEKLIVMCRSGGRSAHCADFLVTQGFQNVVNLDGGILAWSDEVDSSIAKY